MEIGRDLDSYLAGIFDGEGWVETRLAREGRTLSIKVGVGMYTPIIPKLFYERFGGLLYSYRDNHYHTHHIKWTWAKTGKNCQEVLELFSRLCIVKNEECNIALEGIALLTKGKGQGKNRTGVVRVSEENLQARHKLIERKAVAREAYYGDYRS